MFPSVLAFDFAFAFDFDFDFDFDLRRSISPADVKKMILFRSESVK